MGVQGPCSSIRAAVPGLALLGQRTDQEPKLGLVLVPLGCHNFSIGCTHGWEI